MKIVDDSVVDSTLEEIWNLQNQERKATKQVNSNEKKKKKPTNNIQNETDTKTRAAAKNFEGCEEFATSVTEILLSKNDPFKSKNSTGM